MFLVAFFLALSGILELQKFIENLINEVSIDNKVQHETTTISDKTNSENANSNETQQNIVENEAGQEKLSQTAEDKDENLIRAAAMHTVSEILQQVGEQEFFNEIFNQNIYENQPDAGVEKEKIGKGKTIVVSEEETVKQNDLRELKECKVVELSAAAAIFNEKSENIVKNKILPNDNERTLEEEFLKEINDQIELHKNVPELEETYAIAKSSGYQLETEVLHNGKKANELEQLEKKCETEEFQNKIKGKFSDVHFYIGEDYMTSNGKLLVIDEEIAAESSEDDFILDENGVKRILREKIKLESEKFKNTFNALVLADCAIDNCDILKAKVLDNNQDANATLENEENLQDNLKLQKEEQIEKLHVEHAEMNSNEIFDAENNENKICTITIQKIEIEDKIFEIKYLTEVGDQEAQIEVEQQKSIETKNRHFELAKCTKTEDDFDNEMESGFFSLENDDLLISEEEYFEKNENEVESLRKENLILIESHNDELLNAEQELRIKPVVKLDKKIAYKTLSEIENTNQLLKNAVEESQALENKVLTVADSDDDSVKIYEKINNTNSECDLKNEIPDLFALEEKHVQSEVLDINENTYYDTQITNADITQTADEIKVNMTTDDEEYNQVHKEDGEKLNEIKMISEGKIDNLMQKDLIDCLHKQHVVKTEVEKADIFEETENEDEDIKDYLVIKLNAVEQDDNKADTVSINTNESTDSTDSFESVKTIVHIKPSLQNNIKLNMNEKIASEFEILKQQNNFELHKGSENSKRLNMTDVQYIQLPNENQKLHDIESNQHDKESNDKMLISDEVDKSAVFILESKLHESEEHFKELFKESSGCDKQLNEVKQSKQLASNKDLVTKNVIEVESKNYSDIEILQAKQLEPQKYQNSIAKLENFETKTFSENSMENINEIEKLKSEHKIESITIEDNDYFNSLNDDELNTANENFEKFLNITNEVENEGKRNIEQTGCIEKQLNDCETQDLRNNEAEKQSIVRSTDIDPLDKLRKCHLIEQLDKLKPQQKEKNGEISNLNAAQDSKIVELKAQIANKYEENEKMRKIKKLIQQTEDAALNVNDVDCFQALNEAELNEADEKFEQFFKKANEFENEFRENKAIEIMNSTNEAAKNIDAVNEQQKQMKPMENGNHLGLLENVKGFVAKIYRKRYEKIHNTQAEHSDGKARHEHFNQAAIELYRTQLENYNTAGSMEKQQDEFKGNFLNNDLIDDINEITIEKAIEFELAKANKCAKNEAQVENLNEHDKQLSAIDSEEEKFLKQIECEKFIRQIMREIEKRYWRNAKLKESYEKAENGKFSKIENRVFKFKCERLQKIELGKVELKIKSLIKEKLPAKLNVVENFKQYIETIEADNGKADSTSASKHENKCRLPQYAANVRSCNCCPYGYHIDLDFVRYCEALANAKPSEEELRRRSRRRSRKSMEFMLGFESLFDQWDTAERVQAVPEASHESDSPISPRATAPPPPPPRISSSTPYRERSRSASVPRLTYGGLTRAESPFDTASSTCSSMRGAESDVPYSMHRPANSPPETRAFLHDALDEVCSDFERTLERASVKRRKAGLGGNMSYSVGSDRNNNKTTNGFSCLEKRNCYTWDHNFDVYDSCVSGNKSPRSSRSFSRSHTLPFQRKLSPAEQQYESYVQATVAANAKSPVEEQRLIPPPPPPRRHALSAKLLSEPKVSTTETERTTTTITTLLSSSTNATTHADGAADAQTLYNIRQQMALSLKRMKDLEEQVKTIPELQYELNQLREEKQRMQQTLQLKDDELQRARETKSHSSSPSPVASPKYASPTQFTPQRISPISLESLGTRLRTNSTSSERQLKSILKRDVGTMCGLHVTRDIAVGSPVLTFRTVGTNPMQCLNITEFLYTQLEMEEYVQVAISRYEEQRVLQHLKNLISVGTQMYVPERNVRDSGAQTSPEKSVLKFEVGVVAKPNTRESYVHCKPSVRTVGSSEHRITDILCEKCAAIKRSVAVSTEDCVSEAKSKTLSLKLLEMPGRSNTFSLGESEKLNLKRKTIGTQYMPTAVHNASSQTVPAITHSVSIQMSPDTQNISTQSHIQNASRQTDTRDLVRLCTTQTSTDEISAPTSPASKPAPLSAKQMCSTGSNTELRKTNDYGVNTAPPATTRHSSSNTEEVHKRDIACGDVVKPHISIACADNYCDSCKDAIKNLAKDFSKVLASPLPTRAVDSKIPRPKHITSPSPVRRQFQRQNTYTITPSPTPSPVVEKKIMSSSLHEKPPTIASFHQDASSETQSFITEPISRKTSSAATTTVQRRPSNSNNKHNEELEAALGNVKQSSEFQHLAEGDLIVKEETRVRISWSRDASPAAGTPPRSLESSFNEKFKQSLQTEATKQALTSTTTTSSVTTNISKGARKKTTATSALISSQTEDDVPTVQPVPEPTLEQKPPSQALLQKLAMVEAEPRQKFIPTEEMLSALKTINSSLLKKMGAKPFSSSSLKAAKTTIQQDWFRISSTEQANPHEVEDYLDCFENLSVPLLEYCVNMVDANGNTAMHYAVSHGNFDVVSILLDSKVCNVNQMNNAGYTCVMLVSLAKLKNAAHRTVVERLFQMADVNIRAKKHCQTALMLAVSHGNIDMVQMLLAAGADINIQDEDGSTALMCAAEHGRVDIVKLLLSQADCDSLINDMDGSTAFKIAWQAGHRDIGLLLYVHEQMLRSRMPNRGETSPRTPTSLSPRHYKPAE